MKNKYLTEEQVDQQENLSAGRLAILQPQFAFDSVPDRPKQNLIDLMHWAKNTFNKGKGHCWIHNKIVIDGSFLEFAEQTSVKIECLYRDSIASWQSDLMAEHFMAQGVFQITYKKLKFLHCALFHKGNQNEDEVSFFVIMEDKDYPKYLEFRNSFDEWLSERDRNNLEIHVVGADSIPYEKDLSWDDVFLPEKMKSDIKMVIEGFLKSRDFYEQKKIPWKKGCIFYGSPGGGKTLTIRTIISNYDFKPVTVMTGQQTNDEVITSAFEYAQEQSPALLYIEDLDTLLGSSVNLSHFLNLMDGVSSRNGIFVIATANDLSCLNEAVLDRPSRFDRKWEFPNPTKDLASKYLKKWFGSSISAKTLTSIVNSAVQKKFSYAYLKELYITSIYYAISENRKEPTISDIERAMEQLLSDKNAVESGFDGEEHSPVGIRD